MWTFRVPSILTQLTIDFSRKWRSLEHTFEIHFSPEAEHPLSSKTDPSFRLVNLAFTLNIASTELSLTRSRPTSIHTTRVPAKLLSNIHLCVIPSIRNFDVCACKCARRTNSNEPFETSFFSSHALSSRVPPTLLNSPLRCDAWRFTAAPSLRFRHVSSWNLCVARGLSAFLARLTPATIPRDASKPNTRPMKFEREDLVHCYEIRSGRVIKTFRAAGESFTNFFLWDICGYRLRVFMIFLKLDETTAVKYFVFNFD